MYMTYVKEQLDGNVCDEGAEWRGVARRRALSAVKSFKARYQTNVISVLDVGCRYGEALQVFETEMPSARVAGVDIVPEFVAEASQVCDEVTVADACSLPFKDGEFGFVFSHHTLEHTLDLAQAINEMRRVALVGFYITVPLETAEKCAMNKSHHWHRETVEEWLKDLLHPDWRLVFLVKECDTTIMMVRKEYA